jgi:hypothetical protein
LAAQIDVMVGGNPARPPFTVGSGGLAADLLAALNDNQTRFRFHLVALPDFRIREALREGQLALWIFHQAAEGDPGDPGPPLLRDGNRFIAQKGRVKDATFFLAAGRVETLAVAGVAYDFADGVTDEAVLRERYHTTTVADETLVAQRIAGGRGQIGLISAVGLDYLAKADPATRDLLSVSPVYDSEFDRIFLVSPRSPVTPVALGALVQRLADSGKLGEVYARYGLRPPARLLDPDKPVH